MKVAIIGGGPSGLYLGLLLKRRQPAWVVEVVEQNSPASTFGFGVVLADTGLLQLQQADRASYDALCSAMRYTDRQIIVHREQPIDIAPRVRGGAIPRVKLLQIMEAEAQQAGVKIHFGAHIDSTAELERFSLADADVIVGADGINSVLRRQFAAEFGTTTRILGNRFAWYGTTHVFETSALVFRTWKGGHFVAHYYPYSDTMSTFVAETDEATWSLLELGTWSDDQRQALFEELFAPELEGASLISNKSFWRQFSAIRNQHWAHGRHVLIGDALASAHFSIGSGTRIAMTDSIALAAALLQSPDDALAALAHFERTHARQKQKLIDASERSFEWYERMADCMDRSTPEEFVYQFMTRTGRVDDKRLRTDFPDLMRRIDAARTAASSNATSHP